MCYSFFYIKANLVGNSNPHGDSVSSGVTCIACSQEFGVLFPDWVSGINPAFHYVIWFISYRNDKHVQLFVTGNNVSL